jgi:Uma2 family endonuclease
MVSPRLVELQSGRKDTVINPILIVDVLSDSTQACDRDEKFAAYRTIAIVQEICWLINRNTIVEQYTKQGANQWLFTEDNGQHAQVQLAAIPVEIALADLYENGVL